MLLPYSPMTNTGLCWSILEIYLSGFHSCAAASRSWISFPFTISSARGQLSSAVWSSTPESFWQFWCCSNSDLRCWSWPWTSRTMLRQDSKLAPSTCRAQALLVQILFKFRSGYSSLFSDWPGPKTWRWPTGSTTGPWSCSSLSLPSTCSSRPSCSSTYSLPWWVTPTKGYRLDVFCNVYLVYFLAKPIMKATN